MTLRATDLVLVNRDGVSYAATGADVGAPAGSVMMFGGDKAPLGYLECAGQAVSRSTYSQLFAAIGTTFGNGNGSSTFNVPDLRGQFVRGWDHGRGVDQGRKLGSGQGDQNKQHNHTATSTSSTTATQPAHSHTGSTGDAGEHTHGASAADNGAHTHSGSTNTTGNHAHSGTSAYAGNHSHSGSTNTTGNHTHGGSLGSASLTGNAYHISETWGKGGTANGIVAHQGNNNSGGTPRDGTDASPTGRMIINASHSHSWSMSGAGNHAHSIGTNTTGNHRHSFGTNTTGNHAHSLSTSSNGNHSHTLSVAKAGNHNHSVSVGNAQPKITASTTTTTTIANEGGESRPVNVALMYIIKY